VTTPRSTTVIAPVTTAAHALAPPVARDLREAASGVLARALPARWLEQQAVLPLGVNDDGAVVLAAAALPDATVLDALARTFRRAIVPVLHPAGELRAALMTAERQAPAIGASGEGQGEAPLDDLRALAAQEPVIQLVNVTLLDALRAGASDVHIEALADDVRVRYRVDGVLRDVTRLGRQYHAAVISRVKIMAGLDIAERRRPQDGRIRITLEGRDVDLRVSTLPGLHGEGVVLRLLDAGTVAPELAALGMSDGVRRHVESLLTRTGGLLLVTGPTGSGKTTTLYAAIARLNSAAVKIVTVEDPIEYRMAGVTQVPVNTKAGMHFATALRSILRHDPDIIMIGELRDAETAAIAIQAALTGHLVLATLHTTDAVGAVTRLIDMGVEPYLVSATVEGVLAQRLVRALCDACAVPRAPSAMERTRWGSAATTPREARGCAVCGGTGYRGRTGIHELLVPDDTFRAQVLQRLPPATLRTTAAATGTLSLAAHADALVRSGVTTSAEVARALGDRDA